MVRRKSVAERIRESGMAAGNGRIPPKPKNTFRMLPAYQPFPLTALPLVLRDYVSASSAAIGCDPALVALPALAVTMASIGNSRAILLRKGWSEPAVLWAITIMRSGGVKSAGFAAAVDPLMEIQMEHWDQYQREKSLCEEDEDRPKPKEPPCYVTSDATVAAVGELLRDNPRGLLLGRDELDGWFQSFTRFSKGGDSTDRPHWLELHGARALRLDRITRAKGPVSIRRACCSLCGTVQPSVFEAAMSVEAQASGLGARFLVAMPPLRKRVWTEAQVSEEIAGRYSRLLSNLLELTLADPIRRRPHFLHLGDSAKSLWVQFFNDWGERQYSAFDAEAAVLAKLEGYAARLTLLHHVITHVVCGIDDVVPITESSVAAAIELTHWFAAEAERCYGSMRATVDERQMRELIEWIERQGGAVTAQQLRDCRRGQCPTTEDAEFVLSELKGEGVGDWKYQPPGPKGGRPTRLFILFALQTSKTPVENGVPSAQFPENGAGSPLEGSKQRPREPGEDENEE